MNPTDQTLKLRLVLLTGILALIGFALEVGPVGGAFSLINSGPPVVAILALQLPALGFLGYLALAASAVVGLHLTEPEPRAKEGVQEPPALQAAGKGEAVGERVRARPELHQFRMFFTALGGYTLLKGVSLAVLWHASESWPPALTRAQLFQGFEFGFFYVALGWFVLWQFLRWYATRRRWVRLQEELVGGDVSRMIAVVILVKPLVFIVTTLGKEAPHEWSLTLLSLLLHLAVVAGAALLWSARPFALRRTVLGLLITGGAVIVLTAILAIIERRLTVG